jgi:hypothetical protein
MGSTGGWASLAEWEETIDTNQPETSKDAYQETVIPLEYRKSRPSRGTRTYFAMVPPDWPDIEITGGTYLDRLYNAKYVLESHVDCDEVMMVGPNHFGPLRLPVNFQVFRGKDYPIPVVVYEGEYRHDDRRINSTDIEVILRIKKYFPFSPLAFFSVGPIPDGILYFCNNTPEVMMQGFWAGQVPFRMAIDIKLKKSNAENFKNIADMFKNGVRGFLGIDIDYTQESLPEIDRAIATLHWRRHTPTVSTTIYVLMNFIGEFVRRNTCGKWATTQGGAMSILLDEIPGFPGRWVELNVEDTAIHLIREAPEGMFSGYFKEFIRRSQMPR